MSIPVIEMPRMIRKTAKYVGEKTVEKNEAYGNSVVTTEKALKIYYPNGIKLSQYKDVFLVVRTLDKISRIAHKKRAFGENPWSDIAGYGVLGSVESGKVVDGDDVEVKISVDI